MEKTCTRRSFLKSTGVTLAAFGLTNSLLSSCKRKQSFPEPTFAAKQDLPEACPSDNALSEQQIAIRNNLRYIDKTFIPNRTCDNCKLYTLPKNNSPCGGCTVVPGPIHPKGYCISWYARM